LYLFPWHFISAYLTMRGAGYDPATSLYTGLIAVWADFKPGTQGLGEAATNRHAMGGQKKNSSCYQKVNEAKAGTEKFIQSMIKGGNIDNLGYAFHANEDIFTKSHAYKKWTGYWNLDFFGHLFWDIVPYGLLDAHRADSKLIERFKK